MGCTEALPHMRSSRVNCAVYVSQSFLTRIPLFTFQSPLSLGTEVVAADRGDMQTSHRGFA